MRTSVPSFIKIAQAVKKLNSISRAWLNGDGRFCVQLCIEILCKQATSVAHLTNVSFEFFYEIFREDASLLLLYHVEKVKDDQKLKSRGVKCFPKNTIVLSGKKLNSISREQLNFRRRPFWGTTLYRNLMQAPNFVDTFDQLFYWISLWKCHRRCLSKCSIPLCKKVKNDQKLKSRGESCLKLHWMLRDCSPLNFTALKFVKL